MILTHKSSHGVRRYRSNPIEVTIFTVILLIFVNSIYRLLYGYSTFSTPILTHMNSNPISEQRGPASVAQNFISMDIQCGDTSHHETTANKLRFKGSLCGADSEASSVNLLKASIVNKTNEFNATVFTDTASNQFSTDYIPLTIGNNSITFEFRYHGGKSVSQQIDIQRN